MCQVPSWIETETDEIVFLQDKDVIRFHENKGTPINWNDFTGHSGIQCVYSGIEGKHKEGFPCPKEILNTMLSGKMREIIRHAENIQDFPKELSSVLAKLSTDENSHVRWRVAENPNTSKSVLAKLSTDEHWGVRWRVAENPNTSK